MQKMYSAKELSKYIINKCRIYFKFTVTKNIILYSRILFEKGEKSNFC